MENFTLDNWFSFAAKIAFGGGSPELRPDLDFVFPTRVRLGLCSAIQARADSYFIACPGGFQILPVDEFAAALECLIGVFAVPTAIATGLQPCGGME